MSANQLSVLDRARVAFAGRRYDFWLDLRYVRRRTRRDLRTELTANLTEAAADVGVSQALANVGSLRTLAADATRTDEPAARWYAGTIAALTAFTASLFLFVVQALTYVEGVLDSGTDDGEVGSSLFPFLWSEVVVEPSSDGFAFTLFPGPMPIVFAAVVGAVVARPWRAIRPSLNAASIA